MMTVTINGEKKEFADLSGNVPLSEMIETHLKLGDTPVLVELNGKALLKTEISDRSVADGDVLEIVRMVAGG